MHNFGGGRSDLFNSRGRWSKGGGIFSKFRGTLDEAITAHVRPRGENWSKNQNLDEKK